MTKEDAAVALLAVHCVIMKMSDDAAKLGGASTISGVASLHKLQSSIQKNRPRLAAIAEALGG